MRTRDALGVMAAAAAFVCARGAYAGGGDGYGGYVGGGWSGAPVQDATPVSPTPEPGRVPLQIESVGAPQVVGLYLGQRRRGWGRRAYSVSVHQDFCRTPCQLFALPGEVPLYVSGPGIVGRPVELGMPPTGLRVRVGAPSSAAVAGGVLFVTFGAIALTTALVFLPVGLSVDDQGLTIAGGVLGTGGLAMMITGIVFVAGQQYGVMWSGPPLGAPLAPGASSTPTSAAVRSSNQRVASWSLSPAASVLPSGGATVGATLRF